MKVHTRNSQVVKLAGAGVLAVALVGAGVHFSSGLGGSEKVGLTSSDSTAAGATPSGTDTAAATTAVDCPDVADQLHGVPARALHGVTKQLVTLKHQISTVDAAVAADPAQATSQLAALNHHRHIAIVKIIVGITRAHGDVPADLSDLAPCTVTAADVTATDPAATGAAATDAAATTTPAATDPAATDPAATNPAATDPAATDPGATTDAAATADAASTDVAATDTAAATDSAAPTDAAATTDAAAATDAPAATGTAAADAVQIVSCPGALGELGVVPTRAAAEVARNLLLLDHQVAQADDRLTEIATASAGDPALVQNAVLGPLADKRTATLNRIATAISRVTQEDVPGLDDVSALATCTLTS
jgi:hypothetical protein